MNPYTQAALLTASTLRMLPHIALYLLHRKQIDVDLEKYSADGRGLRAFIKVATRQRVFRNLFYYRLGEYVSVFIKWLLPPERIEHNYATYLNAERIGSDFYCLQLVTLGNDAQMRRPTIGNHVSIYTGATVFGGITIGDNVVIGAGSVVRRSVPANCTVAGNPAVIVRRDGQKTHIPL